jgi:hypothetical protein
VVQQSLNFYGTLLAKNLSIVVRGEKVKVKKSDANANAKAKASISHQIEFQPIRSAIRSRSTLSIIHCSVYTAGSSEGPIF